MTHNLTSRQMTFPCGDSSARRRLKWSTGGRRQCTTSSHTTSSQSTTTESTLSRQVATASPLTVFNSSHVCFSPAHSFSPQVNWEHDPESRLDITDATQELPVTFRYTAK